MNRYIFGEAAESTCKYHFVSHVPLVLLVFKLELGTIKHYTVLDCTTLYHTVLHFKRFRMQDD